MTQTELSIFFFGIIFVIAIAMIIHSWIDKGRIRKNFDRLASELSGQVLQENGFIYPRFSAEVSGRHFDLFFKVVKAGRKEILYYIYSLKTGVTEDILLLKKDYFKPITDEDQFTEEAGILLSNIDSRYQVRSQHVASAQTIFKEANVNGYLTSLDEFSSLQLGPDALVVGKPYDGTPDTEPTNILRNLHILEKLAEAMERCPSTA
ncbi:MAG: hypothetical protein ABGX83_02155 [Nitrospira sp.]|nr:hypothetical protein [Candidatus Manganitrophaceae bacterium]HIL34517.1 hypothetical protein [Candidatus Manganitrophaceae bacterium]